MLKVCDFGGGGQILRLFLHIALFTSLCSVPGIRRGMHELRWPKIGCRVQMFYPPPKKKKKRKKRKNEKKKRKKFRRCSFITEFQVKPVAKHKRCTVTPAPVRPPAPLTQLSISAKQFPICGYTGNDPEQQRIQKTSTSRYKSSDCFQVHVEIYRSYFIFINL